MNNEARERKPDRWPGDLRRAAEIPGDGEIADDPSFVKAAPVEMRGAWRKAHHCNFWWVVRHHMMYPCRGEREAEKLCRRLREEWDENSLSAASRASG